MIKVSVIVPVFNQENFIKRCIDSLINQTLKELEIIIVNDCSTDRSLDVINKIKGDNKDKNIIIINSEENLKQGGARNLGLLKAKGEYIGFVDSDDWVDITMFEKLYNIAKAEDSDIVDCNLLKTSGADNFELEVSNLKEQVGEINFEKQKSLVLRPGRIVTKLIKKEIFKENNIKFSENVFFEDNEIAPIIAISAKKISKVNEGLYYYYIKEESTTRGRNNYLKFDRLVTSLKMVEQFKERGLYDRFKSEIEWRFTELYYINTILMCIFEYDVLPKEKLLEMKSCMKKEFPKYRENKYFKSKVTKINAIITKLNDINYSFIAALKEIIMLKKKIIN